MWAKITEAKIEIPNDDLFQLLGEHLPPETVKEIAELLAPFYKRMQGGYPLKPADELNPDEIARAISQATGQEVREVVLVSLSATSPRPRWMTAQVFRGHFVAGLLDSFGNDLWADLSQISSGNDIRGGSQKDLRKSFRSSLGDRLGASLRASLKNVLWGSFTESAVNRFVGDRELDLIGTTLSRYLEAELAGDSRLRSLVRLLPHCLPLGKKKDEPGVWLVLCD